MTSDAAGVQSHASNHGEEHFRSIFSQAAVGISQVDLNGRWLLANQRFCEMLGYTHAELMIRTWADIRHPEDADEALAGSRQMLAGEGPWHTMEKRFIRRDGSIVWARIHRSLLRDEDNRPQSYLHFVEEIGHQKQAELALYNTEQRLNLAQSATGMVLWERDVRTNQLECSAEFNRLYGLDPAKLRLSYEEVLARIHPEDRDRVHTLVQEAIVNRSGWECEYRVVWPNEQVHWLYGRGIVLLDDAGQPIRLVGVKFDITARKQAEAALHESELRYKELFESTSDCILLLDVTADQRFTIVAFNAAEEKKAGLAARNAKGRFVEEVFTAETAKTILSNYRRCVETNATIQYEETIEAPVRRRHFHTVLIPVRRVGGRIHRIVEVSRDVTTVKRAEAALQESEARFRDLADNAPVMMCSSGPDGLATFFNRAWLEFRGHSMEEEVGYGWASGVHPDDIEKCLAQYSASFDLHRECHIEYRLRRADGEYRWLVCKGAPRFDSQGVFLGYTASGVDVTEIKRAQQEALAAQKLESMGVLSSGIAHDFNNLLGGILACAELAIADPTGSEDCLQRIRSSAMRGAEIVRQLMIYGGNESPRMERVNVSLLIEEMLELLKLSVSKRAKLTLNLDHNAPVIQADPTQIRQLMLNLVSNASEALGDGEGAIAISSMATKVAHTTHTNEAIEGDYLLLEVSDTGCGISPEMKQRVFDPFFTTKQAGRGLGLAVVQGIVRRHHGSVINLISSPGNGTTFQIFLPRDRTNIEELNREQNASNPVNHTSMRPQTILVIEDEENLGLAVSLALRKKGFSVLRAENGSTAIELLREHKSEVDAVLLDLTLPGASALEVLEQVRFLGCDLKVIVTSAYPEERAQADLSGFQIDHFLRKPFHIADLLELLEE